MHKKLEQTHAMGFKGNLRLGRDPRNLEDFVETALEHEAGLNKHVRADSKQFMAGCRDSKNSRGLEDTCIGLCGKRCLKQQTQQRLRETSIQMQKNWVGFDGIALGHQKVHNMGPTGRLGADSGNGQGFKQSSDSSRKGACMHKKMQGTRSKQHRNIRILG